MAPPPLGLPPFGYRLELRFDADWNQTLYDLYCEGKAEPLLPGLSPLWEVPLNASVNTSGTGFALAVKNVPNTRPLYLLLNSGEVQEWDSGESWALPGYVADDLARVTHTSDVSFTCQVELGTRSVYTGTVAPYGAHMPLRSFTTRGDHWVLEVDDHLIMDGQDIGQTLGYDAAFGLARIGGQLKRAAQVCGSRCWSRSSKAEPASRGCERPLPFVEMDRFA